METYFDIKTSMPFDRMVNYINNTLSREGLDIINWRPYYHGYNYTTKKHNGIIKELASTPFQDIDNARPYINVLSKNNITFIFNKTRSQEELKIWIPVDKLSQNMVNSHIHINKTNDSTIVLNRAIGCLLGMGIGDALGVTHEIFPRGSFDDTIQMVLAQREKLRLMPHTKMLGGTQTDNIGGKFGTVILEPGDFTDDTSMGLCLADSLLVQQRLDLVDLMKRFVSWWDTGYNASVRQFVNGKWVGKSVGLGGNISKALQKFKTQPNNPIVGGTDPDKDAGNGAIMRVGPIALYWYNDIKMAMKMAKLQASVTHNIPEVKDGCALMTFIICKGLSNKSKHTILDSLHTIAPSLENNDIIDLTRPTASWKTKKEIEIITLPGRNLWSLEAALWCIYNTDNFKDAILKAVNLGGDADTIGAITGQLAGAIYGLDNIPEQWLNTLKHRFKIEKRAIALIKKEPFNNGMII